MSYEDFTPRCQSQPDAFIPANGHLNKRFIANAKAICSECPLLPTCRKYAVEKMVLTTSHWNGRHENQIVGGLTTREILELRKPPKTFEQMTVSERLDQIAERMGVRLSA